MADILEQRYNESTAASRPLSQRLEFIKRTYLLVGISIAAFVGIEAALIQSGVGLGLVKSMAGTPLSFLVLLVAFVLGSFVAQYFARAKFPPAVKYAGLALYIALEAVIILPLLIYADQKFPGKQLALQAGAMTLAVFGTLTAVVMISKRDFSWLGPVISIGCVLAFVTIILGMVFGFTLGLAFMGIMVALMAASIVYETSNIVHHYDTDEHVAAALGLFASIATMFFYILRILMSLSSDR